MKRQLRKEMRLLLPAWCFAIFLAALPFHLLFPRYRTGWTSNILEPAMVNVAALTLGLLLLAVSSFGREFARQTFQLFLSQPISRNRLWRHKMAVLGAATISVWLVFWAMFSYAYGFSLWTGAGSLIASLAIVSTSLWATLLFRQILPAFCFSLLMPAALGPLVWPLIGKTTPTWVLTIACVLGIAYSVLGFSFAYHLFRRAQDLTSSRAVSLSFSRRRPAAAFSGRGRDRPRRRPLWTLAVKEIYLHQVNLICGFALFLGLGVAAAFLAETKRTGVFEGVQISFGLAWLFMPVLAGAVAIAEERKIGALESQQCLPVSQLRQFLVKLGVTCGVILLLGLALPLLVTWIVTAVTGVDLVGADWFKTIGVYTAVAGALALYASSLFRSTLGALALALVGLFAGLFIWLALQEFWRGVLLLMLVGLPTGTLVLLVLSFRNFREHLVDSRVRRQNALVLTAAAGIVLMLTGLVHYRTWEAFTPEPPLGSPQAALADGATAYKAGWFGPWILHLPDGRIWMSELPDSGLVTFPESGRFVGEPGWKKVAASDHGAAGIRMDGTLWRFWEEDADPDGSLKSLGDDGMRWADLGAGEYHVLAIAENGSLWGWGSNSSAQLGDLPPKGRISEPMRIGSDSDWIRVHATDSLSLGVKQDGSLWRWGRIFEESGIREVQQPERWEVFPERELLKLSGDALFPLAVLDDGSLWSWGWVGEGRSWHKTPRRVGDRADWRTAVLGSTDAIVALSRDGSLWGRNLRRDPRRDSYHDLEKMKPTERLSRHSRWVALTAEGNFMWHRPRTYALADDGSWWMWEVNPDARELLAPSRRPQRLGASQP